MSSLQRQVGLFAIPLRSRQHANRTCQNQSGSREFSLPERAGRWLRYFGGPWAFPSPPTGPGSRDPALRSPSVAGFRALGPLKHLVTGMDGEPWSEMDLEDLRHSLDYGKTFAATARFLCRDEDDVRQKARALGLTEQLVTETLPLEEWGQFAQRGCGGRRVWRLRRLVMGACRICQRLARLAKTPLRRGFFLANDPNALAGVRLLDKTSINSERPRGGCGRHRGLAPLVPWCVGWRNAARLRPGAKFWFLEAVARTISRGGRRKSFQPAPFVPDSRRFGGLALVD